MRMGNRPNTQNLSHTEYSTNNNEQTTTVQQLNYLTSSPAWYINFKEYTKQRWKRLLPLIKKTDVDIIVLQQISSPDLLASFLHIEFHILRRLQLKNVHIYSLEKIAQLNIPCLESLQFNSNRVVSLRPLRKLHTPNLKILEFYENRIQEGDWLTQCNFSIQMEKLVMFSPNSMQVPQCYNWLVKMKIEKLDLFEYYSRRVIDNSQMKSMVKKRFPELRLAMRYDRIQ